MKHVELGKSRLKVSAIGMGTWQIGSKMWQAQDPESIEQAKRSIERAIELGVTLFDTAELYGGGLSESVLGEVVGNRDDIVVMTKVAWYRTTRESIVRAAERSRARLRRDSIDILLFHWPPPFYVPIKRVVQGLEDAVDRGIASYIGVSNFPTNLLKKALESTRKHDIVVNQVQYSLAYRVVENRLAPFMKEHGIKLVAWSPLAKGALSGRKATLNKARSGDEVFKAAVKDRTLQKALEEVSNERGASPSQVALAWIIAKGGIPIPGARRPFYVDEIARAASLELTSREIEELDAASERYRTMWGVEYKVPLFFRLLPALAQRAIIGALGGI